MMITFTYVQEYIKSKEFTSKDFKAPSEKSEFKNNGKCNKIMKIMMNQKKYNQPVQGAKKVSSTACHSGKLQLTCISPKVISPNPKNIVDEFPKKGHLPIG